MASPSTEAAQGQCSAQTIPGALHRAPRANMHSMMALAANNDFSRPVY
jgi:hypothetical protein